MIDYVMLILDVLTPKLCVAIKKIKFLKKKREYGAVKLQGATLSLPLLNVRASLRPPLSIAVRRLWTSDVRFSNE